MYLLFLSYRGYISEFEQTRVQGDSSQLSSDTIQYNRRNVTRARARAIRHRVISSQTHHYRHYLAVA